MVISSGGQNRQQCNFIPQEMDDDGSILWGLHRQQCDFIPQEMVMSITEDSEKVFEVAHLLTHLLNIGESLQDLAVKECEAGHAQACWDLRQDMERGQRDL